LFSPQAIAHGISQESKEMMANGGILEFIWLGAEHMLTGYDHLLFLFGVLFFLSGFRDIVRFITAFTLGHCITLLGATLAGISANAYAIDAVIALSVLYKAFENLDGFKKYLSINAPNLLAMVFAFGLIHGFGLSTRLQEFSLGNEGIVTKILAFNIGVELGQIIALSVILGLFAAWRSSKRFEQFGTAANIGLLCAGAGLFVYQMNGFFTDSHSQEEEAHVHAEEEHHHNEHSESSEHGHEHSSEHGHDHNTEHENGKNTDPGHTHSTLEEKDAPKENKEDKDSPTKSHSHGEKEHHHHKHKSDKKKSKSKDHSHSHSHGSGKEHKH
jgi:hypothetical protein